MRVLNYSVTQKLAADPFERLRSQEFSRLDQQGQVYLDYTGAALYPESLLHSHSAALQSSVLGNPHSNNPASLQSTQSVDAARADVLAFFNADPDEYMVVFTANASNAIKLVAESFPFQSGSSFALTADNHNSVNGIRQFAARAGAHVRYLPLDRGLGVRAVAQQLAQLDTDAPSLFAYPAQSNFSGIRHALSHVETAQRLGYSVLLDAAAYVPTSLLNLAKIRPDFVAISFYKMFGYPTGIGALIARRSALKRLIRPWFAGGTVDYVSTQSDLYGLSAGEAAFEDGTVNFASAVAVQSGLAFLSSLGMGRIARYVDELSEELRGALRRLRHPGGGRKVRLYGSPDLDHGSCVAFNVLDQSGRVVPYEHVEQMACDQGISLRGGCFCNPGCAEAAFGFEKAKTEACLNQQTAGAFSPRRLAHCLETHEVGCLRVSVGIANVRSDIYRLIDFLDRL